MNKFKKHLKIPALVFYGVGMILGAGIYSIIGPAAGIAGDHLWVSFIFAGLIAYLTGLSYAELASRFPSAGAEFTYMQEIFPTMPWISFTVGTAIWLIGAASAATVATAFSDYFTTYVEANVRWVAVFLLLAMSAVNIFGIRESSRFNIVATLVEISGLLIVAFVAFQHPVRAAELSANPFDATVFPAAALIFFAFLGFENIATLAEECDNPCTAIPKAIFISLGITTGLYVLVAISTLLLSDPEMLANSAAPLQTIILIHSPQFSVPLTIIALFATANTALIAILSSSRVLYAMARSRHLPQFLGRIHPKTGTPIEAILAVCLMACLLIPLKSLSLLAGLASFGSLLVFASVHAAVIAINERNVDQDLLFTGSLRFRGFSAVPVIGLALVGSLLTQFEADVYRTGAAILLIVWGCHLISRHWRKRKPATPPVRPDD